MKKSILTLSICCLLFVGLSSCSESLFDNHQQLTENVINYEKAEFQVVLEEDFQNPYDGNDIALNMILKSPSGKMLFLPAYFESGNNGRSIWIARFAPQEIGDYSYHFEVLKNGKEFKKSTGGGFRSLNSEKNGFLHINDMWTLKYDSGKPFRGIGENIGWESRSYEDPKYDYDYLLPTLSNNGANFFRSWMAPNNFPLEWKKVKDTNRYSDTDEYFNPGGVNRLDEVVELADSLGLNMMLAFDSHNTLIEGNQWEIHNYNVKNGGPATSPTEFFTLEASKKMYKNRLRYIVARWGYSTSIGAWEFFNEIDNAVFTRGDSIIIPHTAVTKWHKEMAEYLKTIDPYDHIVTTSVSHREIEGMYAIDALDLNQMHIYKRTKAIPEEMLMYIETYEKPFSWGEFGYEWDWNKDFEKIANEMDHDYKIGLWYGLFNPTPILPMTWWWEFFDERGMTAYFKAVSEINNQMLEAGNGAFESLESDAGEVESFAVKCGDTYFVYLLNHTNDKAMTTLEISVATENEDQFEAKSFLPEQSQYVEIDEIEIRTNKITLTSLELGAKKDMVLIISPVVK